VWDDEKINEIMLALGFEASGCHWKFRCFFMEEISQWRSGGGNLFLLVLLFVFQKFAKILHLLFFMELRFCFPQNQSLGSMWKYRGWITRQTNECSHNLSLRPADLSIEIW
jgi:hypothetical protein